MAPNQRCPIIHPCQSQLPALGIVQLTRRKTTAIVFNFYLELIGDVCEAHADAGRTGMRQDIQERFLDDTEHRRLDGVGQALTHRAAAVALDLDAIARAEILGVLAQARAQAQLDEQRGLEVGDEALELRQTGAYFGAERGKAFGGKRRIRMQQGQGVF